jgi:large subunit ribosomal protein L39e
MGKKDLRKKMRLGKKLKANRRMPILAVVRTHRRVQQNRFQRNWRNRKLKLKG